jgi:tripartite-type tricarboxylate transporter receptor subunit TctC
VLPFAAGGGTDLLARALAQDLGERLGQQFVVENRTGAGGNVGAAAVAKAAPDGYTLLFGTPGPLANNKLMYKNMPYDPEQFVPIVLIAKSPLIIAAKLSLPVKDIKELAAYAKANPGKLNVGVPGNGTLGHITSVLVQKELGIRMCRTAAPRWWPTTCSAGRSIWRWISCRPMCRWCGRARSAASPSPRRNARAICRT